MNAEISSPYERWDLGKAEISETLRATIHAEISETKIRPSVCLSDHMNAEISETMMNAVISETIRERWDLGNYKT